MWSCFPSIVINDSLAAKIARQPAEILLLLHKGRVRVRVDDELVAENALSQVRILLPGQGVSTEIVRKTAL